MSKGDKVSNSVVVAIAFIVLSSLGAFIRFKLTTAQSGFPWMTLLVNMLGCFLIGFIFYMKESGEIKEAAWVLVAIAFLGAMTTFSSFSLDMLKLISEKSYLASLNYFFLSNFLGVLLCFAGFKLASKLINA